VEIGIPTQFGPATRSQAADALVDIGAPAVPALVSTLGGSWPYKLETSASGVLAQIGEPAVPALIEALDDKDVVTRYNAVIVLAEMRASAGAAVPALIERLEDKILLVRSGAVFALVRIGAETRTSEAVLALLDSMDDESLAPYVESYFFDVSPIH
jgi:HEAT repeat protein